MRICPNCQKKFKYPLKFIFLTDKIYKLKCDKCNVELKQSKKTAGINSLVSLIPLIPAILYFDELLIFLDKITFNHNTSISLFVLAFIVWNFFLFNIDLPWTKYEISN